MELYILIRNTGSQRGGTPKEYGGRLFLVAKRESVEKSSSELNKGSRRIKGGGTNAAGAQLVSH